jgi:hypothetical protein
MPSQAELSAPRAPMAHGTALATEPHRRTALANGPWCLILRFQIHDCSITSTPAVFAAGRTRRPLWQRIKHEKVEFQKSATDSLILHVFCSYRFSQGVISTCLLLWRAYLASRDVLMGNRAANASCSRKLHQRDSSYALIRRTSSRGTIITKTKDSEPCGEYGIGDREHGPGSPPPESLALGWLPCSAIMFWLVRNVLMPIEVSVPLSQVKD